MNETMRRKDSINTDSVRNCCCVIWFLFSITAKTRRMGMQTNSLRKRQFREFCASREFAVAKGEDLPDAAK